MTYIQVPQLGEGIESIIVSCWYAKIGDQVAEGDDLVELSADKAIFNLSAPCSGTLKEIFVDVSGEAKIGEKLGFIG